MKISRRQLRRILTETINERTSIHVHNARKNLIGKVPKDWEKYVMSRNNADQINRSFRVFKHWKAWSNDSSYKAFIRWYTKLNKTGMLGYLNGKPVYMQMLGRPMKHTENNSTVLSPYYRSKKDITTDSKKGLKNLQKYKIGKWLHIRQIYLLLSTLPKDITPEK